MKRMTITVATLALAMMAFGSVDAFAQFRGGRYPPMGWYPTPYGYPMRGDFTSQLRLQITPNDAEIYVDGFRAGVADDFDGIFQRLHVTPGEHDVVFYLDGYRTVSQHLYLNPRTDQKIKLELTKLSAGETAGPRPEPAAESQATGRDRRTAPDRPGAAEPDPVKFGTLSLRVVPANADVFIDGERWRTPNALLPLRIELSPGRHKIRVSRANYETFTTEVEIQSGETNAINVSLKGKG